MNCIGLTYNRGPIQHLAPIIDSTLGVWVELELSSDKSFITVYELLFAWVQNFSETVTSLAWVQCV